MRWIVAAGIVVAPALARACPACARDGDSGAVAWMVGAMICVPFVLAGSVFALARRLSRDEGEAP